MPEEAIKQRMSRAIKAAVKGLDQPYGSYIIFLQKSGPFHIEAIRQKEIRIIRIALDSCSVLDEQLVKSAKLPAICTKEIWCKKKDVRGFLKKEIG